MHWIALSFLFGISASALAPISGQDLATGKTVSWSTGSGPTVVVFLSAHCPCSIRHEGALADLAKKSAVPFIGVVSNSSDADVKTPEHFKAAGLGFPIVRQAGHDWADAFGALNTPHAFVVDAKGNLLFQGGVDDSRDAGQATHRYLADALKAISENRAVERPLARPLGCAIRR